MSSKGKNTFFTRLLLIVSWAIALALVLFAGYLGWKVLVGSRQAQAGQSQVAAAKAPELPKAESSAPASLPAVQISSQVRDIYRKALSHTIIPERPSENVKMYTVSTGDSVFEIAAKFKIKPETLLWANYDKLNDNPDTIGLGMELNIPPTDGVYYQWQKGDTVEAVAGRFDAKVDDILGWSENNADLTNPTFEPGTW